MKSIVAVVVLIVCISFTNGTESFFGNKYWILLGQTKPSSHHPGITIKEEVNVAINETRKVDGCLNSWIFTNGFMYFAQDGSLDFTGKNFTVGTYYYYPGPKEPTKSDVMVLWQSTGVYLGTFGAKPNGNDYHRFNSSSSLKANTWVFVGFSVDASKNEVLGWVDDVVTKVSIQNQYHKDMMKGDIVIGKYGKSSSPEPRIELAGVTVMAGAIEETQIETFKTDIISTLTPKCPRLGESGSEGLSRFPQATMMILVLTVGALSRFPNII